MSLFGCILAAVAFLLLGLATDGHFRRLCGQPPGSAWRARFRTGGWALMALSAVPMVAAQGWILGPVAWTGALMLGAGIAFLILNLAPERRGKQP